MVKKAIRKSLLKDKKIFFAINFIFIITIICAVISLYSFGYGLNNYNRYMQETNTEDFLAIPIDGVNIAEEVQEIEELYNLELEEHEQYIYNQNIRQDKSAQLSIEANNPNNNITNIQVTSGQMPTENNQILLSQEFAESNQLYIGDRIKIDNNDYQIVGLGSFPEYSYPVLDGELIPNNKYTGGAYVTQNSFDQLTSGKKTNVTYHGKFKQELSKGQRLDIYYQIQEEYTVQTPELNIVGIPTSTNNEQATPIFLKIIDREDNLEISAMQLEYKYLGIIIAGLSILIGIITVFLAIILFKSIIQNQRREIGILRSEGIFINELIKGYQKYFLISLSISMVIGLILGAITSIAMEILLGLFFNIPSYPVELFLIFLTIIICILIMVFILIAVQFLAIRKNINRDILMLVQNIEKDKYKRKKERQIFNKLSFKIKLKVNTLTRNVSKTLLLFYGVAFSTFLFLFGIIMISAVLNIEDNIYGDNFTYDYIVNYSPTYQSQLEEIDQNNIISFNGDLISINDDQKIYGDISLIGYDIENNDYIDLQIEQQLNGNQVVISQSLSKTYDLKVDDQITVANPINMDETYQFEVVQIVDVKYDEMVYGDINLIQDMLNLPTDYYNGLVGCGQTKEDLVKDDAGATYYSTEDLLESLNSYSQMFNYVIIYMSILAGILAFISIASITSIIIKSNIKTISIMKVLGYSSKEINNLILSGYKWIVLGTYLIMFPLSVVGINLYFNFILNLIPDLNYPLVIDAKLWHFIIGLMFIMSIYYITYLISLRKINKIKLSVSLNKDQ